MKKICKFCEKEYIAKRNISKFCSRECSNKSKIKKIKVFCQYCDLEFEEIPCRIKNGRGKFCSKKCMYNGRNRPHGLKYNIIGNNAGWFEYNHTPWNKGIDPERQPNWRGGKSFEPYSKHFNKELKDNIRKRDNWTCQECNMNQDKLGYVLNIHHIDYNKENNSEENLISLCNSCHTKTNFNRKDWTEYYISRVDRK